MAATAEFSCLSSLPAGFVFRPTEEQLITHYLKNKNVGNESVVSFIKEIDLYKFEPEQLPDKSFIPSDNFEWFFFRANTFDIERTRGTGSWKSTGEPRPIKARGTNEMIATCHIYVFHRGKGGNAIKTNWVIREYRLHPDTKIPSQHQFVIFRLQNENADGQSSSVASQRKKKNITQKNINLDEMTSNTHEECEESEESDDTYSDNEERELRRVHKTPKFVKVSPRKTGSTNVSPSKAQGDNAHTQIVNPPHPSTKRIHHNSSQHPLVCFAKALLGIVMLVIFARDMVPYRHRR